MSDTPLGRFCWYELLTESPDEAPGFYGSVTGWGTAPFDGGPEPYTMWLNGEAPIGGLMALPEQAKQAGAPPHWLGYVSTPDASATAEKARELGATVLDELVIPTVGSIAVLMDPQGAVVCAYQPEAQTPGSDEAPGVGEMSWHELMTESPEAAWDFYSALFGWEKTDQMDMGEMGIYQMFGRDGRTMGGMMNRPPDMPVSSWLYYVRVGDLDAALDAVNSGGGQVLNGPMEVPGGDRVAQCSDAHGAAFALHATAKA